MTAHPVAATVAAVALVTSLASARSAIPTYDVGSNAPLVATSELLPVLPHNLVQDAVVVQIGCWWPGVWVQSHTVQARRVIMLPVSGLPAHIQACTAAAQAVASTGSRQPAGMHPANFTARTDVTVAAHAPASNVTAAVALLESLPHVDVVVAAGIDRLPWLHHTDTLLAAALRRASRATITGGSGGWHASQGLPPIPAVPCVPSPQLQVRLSAMGARAAGLLRPEPCAVVMVAADGSPRLRRLGRLSPTRTADMLTVLQAEWDDVRASTSDHSGAAASLPSRVARLAAAKASRVPPQCHTLWTVLIVGYNNEPFIFNQTAHSIAEGLRDLGFSAVVQVCFGLSSASDGCHRERFTGRQLVVLGANTIARSHVVLANGSEVMAAAWPGFQLLPRDAILYQFEHITDGIGSTQWMTPSYIQLLQMYNVWDYSWANADKLRRLFGVFPTVVPLAHSSHWSDTPSATPALNQGIDVLFAGLATEYRRPILDALQNTSLHVVSVNRVWGDELRRLMDRSKVVLSLRTWGLEGEWKLTRLAPLLAAGRFVIAERPYLSEPPPKGVVADTRVLEDAVVWVTADDVVSEVLRWAGDDYAARRQAVAARGAAVWRQRRMADSLLPAVSALWLQRGCL